MINRDSEYINYNNTKIMFVLKFTVIIGVLEKVEIVNLIKFFLKT